MRRGLLLKIAVLYLLLAVLSFFVASSLGRQLVEDARTQSRADELYRIAQGLANGETQNLFSGDNGIQVLKAGARFLRGTANADILLFDLSGRVLLDSAKPEETEGPVLSTFNYASFGSGFYEVSDLFGYFACSCPFWTVTARRAMLPSRSPFPSSRPSARRSCGASMSWSPSISL